MESSRDGSNGLDNHDDCPDRHKQIVESPARNRLQPGRRNMIGISLTILSGRC
jgi:hypothetical protein